jgi:hypothetical protein
VTPANSQMSFAGRRILPVQQERLTVRTGRFHLPWGAYHFAPRGQSSKTGLSNPCEHTGHRCLPLVEVFRSRATAHCKGWTNRLKFEVSSRNYRNESGLLTLSSLDHSASACDALSECLLGQCIDALAFCLSRYRKPLVQLRRNPEIELPE